MNDTEKAEFNEATIEKVKEALTQSPNDYGVVTSLIEIMEEYDKGPWFENEEPEEKEPFNPEGKTMWEINEILPCIRIYYVPAHNAEEALEFFNTGNHGQLDGSEMWELFSTQEDEVDGNQIEPAKCAGRVHVRYQNEQGEPEPR